MWKTKKQDKQITEKLFATAYETLKEALENILKTEVKTKDENGQDIIDFPLTISSIRIKARIALDFVSNLKKEVDKENK